MIGILKTIIVALVGLVSVGLGLLVVALAAIAVLEGQALSGLVARGASAALGRNVAVTGPVTIDWGLQPTVTATGIAVANADWGSQPTMFAAQRLQARIDLPSLLALDPAIPRFVLEQPALLLETNRLGRGNWEGLLPAAGANTEPAAGAPGQGVNLFGLQTFRITDGALTYRRPGEPGAPVIRIADLQIGAPDAQAPIAFQATGQLGGSLDRSLPIRFSGDLMSLRQLRTAGGSLPVAVEASAGTAALTVEGQIADPLGTLALNLRIAAQGEDLQPLLAALDVEVPSTPAYRLEGTLTGTAPHWEARNVLARLGRTEITGSAALDRSGARPRITGRLEASPLALGELRALAAEAGTGAGTSEEGGGRGLPVEWLTRVDADLTLQAAPIRSPDLPLTAIGAELHLQDGTLTLDPLRIAGAGGTIAGTLVVDAAPGAPTVRLQADADSLALAPLATALGVAAPVQGTVAGRVDLRSRGGTAAQLVSRATGTASLTVDGQLQDRPLRLSGTLGGADWQPGAPMPVDLSGRIAETAVAVTSTASAPDATGVELRVRAHGTDLGPLLALAGIAAPAGGLNHELSMVIRHDGARWRVRDLEAQLGASRLAGSGSLDLTGSKPRVTADLASPHLSWDDLRRLVPAADADGTGGTTADIIPDTPLPFDLLKAANADLAVRVRSVGGTALPLGEIEADLTLNDGVLRLRPLRIDVADGTTRTTMTADATETPPAVQTTMDIERISLEALLTALDVAQRAEGRIGGSLALNSTGTTLQDLAGQLDGTARFFLEDGRLKTNLVNALAFSLPEVFGLLFGSDKGTPVDCVVAAFDIEDGVIDPETLIFVTPDMVVRGQGRVDLGAERLRLGFTPRPRERGLFDITVPVELRGTLADPEIDIGATFGAELARSQACRQAFARHAAAPRAPDRPGFGRDH